MNIDAAETHQKRVTFEKVLASKVTSIWHQMEEQLTRAAIHVDLQVSGRGLVESDSLIEKC